MDALDRLIQLAQIKGEIHTHCIFQGNWQVDHEQQQHAVFHIILSGKCSLTIKNQTFHLQTGDIFFLPKGLAHQLANHLEVNEKSAVNSTAICQISKNSAYSTLSNGNENINLEMFCGAFYYSKQATLIENLPEFLHFSLINTPIANLIELFKMESEKKELAKNTVINALSSVLFTYILRNHLAQDTNQQGILSGLQDKRLSGILSTMLQSPEQPWQIEALAQKANMSRANFIRVFQQKVGESPAKFLINIRLQKAAQLLRQTQQSVLVIALDVGYQSEAHFSKAFKATYGLPPSQYRKNEE